MVTGEIAYRGHAVPIGLDCLGTGHFLQIAISVHLHMCIKV